jgi:hypothetical protein
MKKLTMILLSVMLTIVVCAEESLTMTLNNPEQIWPVVEAALSEANVSVENFNASSNLLQTSFFTYTSMLVKNRANYKITLKGSVVNIEFGDRQYLSSSGWVSNPVPATKAGKTKYIEPILKKIDAISKDPALLAEAVKNSKLFPNASASPSSALNSSASQNNLSMTVTSTRIIGNKIMVSGQLVTSRDMPIRFMHAVTLISPSGNKYETNYGSFAGIEQVYLSQIEQNMTADIPVSYDAIFNVQGEKMSIIKKFSLYMFEPGKTAFAFYDLAVPREIDPNLNESTVEIYKNIYLTFKKQEDKGGHLKIYFVVENKSGKKHELKLNFPVPSVIDANGSKYDDCKVFIAGEESELIEIEPDIPVSGIFDFTGNIPFNSVRVLKFSTRYMADFSIKKIVFQQ